MEQTIRVEAMLAAATSPGDIPQSQLQESGLSDDICQLCCWSLSCDSTR
jgi:hypothetical protein